MKRKGLKKIFGKKFNIWDIILIILVVPYFYLIYQGLSYSSGFLGLYYVIFAPALAFVTVIKWFITFIVKKAR